MEVAPRPFDAGHAVEDARQAAAAALAAVLPEPEAGLAAGILIGLRDRVDRDLAAAFTTAGVSHVVAISGWNIAIVAAAVAACSGRMGRRRRSVVTMAAIVAYVVFAGASASVVRAGAMAGVVLLAREFGRAGRAAAALGWAAAILLLADPGLIGDAGFQLSALATAGLIAWATPTTEAIERLGRGRVPRWLAESLGVSLAAQLATLPVILIAFGRLAILAPAVNLVIVPLVAPAMAAGLVALFGGVLMMLGAPPVAGAVLALPGWVSLRLMVAIVDTAAGIPFASVTLPAPIALAAAGATIAAILGVRVCLHRRRGRASARDRTAEPRPTEPRPGGRRTTTSPSRVLRLAVVSLAVSVVVGGAIVSSRPVGLASRLGHGRRAGRCDPRRGVARRQAAHRRRARPRPVADRARRADPAVGPAHRCRHPHPPPRRPRGRPRAAARPLPHRARLRARDARAWAWVCRLARPPGCRGGARPDGPCPGRSVGRGRHRPPRALADPWPGPGRTARRRDRHQQRLDRAARRGRHVPVPAGRRRRAGDRPVAAPGAAAAARLPQGRPPRQQDRDDAGVRRHRAPEGRRRVGWRGQPVRSPSAVHARTAGGRRRPGLPDRPRRHRRGHLRASRDDGAGGRWASGGRPRRGAGCASRGVPLRHPERRPHPGTRADAAAAGQCPPPEADHHRRVPSSR